MTTLRSPLELPRLVGDLPTTGGALAEPEDFRVEEIPAYLPSGDGEHLYLLIEKRRLTTPQAVERLCSFLGASPREAGYAGLKDREAVTRQWVSIAGARSGGIEGFAQEGLRVLDVSRHGNKLRTGHLRGNRFTIVLHDVVDDALERARAAVDRIEAAGLPNYYGPQRFGRRLDNAEVGLAALRGEGKLPRDRQRKRLIISAAQSQIFNEVVAARLEDDALSSLLGGEVLQRMDSGGMFVSEDQAEDQRRFDAREVVITAPICGPRMIRPKEGSPAEALEQRVFSQLAVDPLAFARFGRLARGGRRAALVWPKELALAMEGRSLTLSFSLPAGSYATVLLREIQGQTAQ